MEDVQESWYNVENEGISHVHSSEEMAELLADAVTEKNKGNFKEESVLMTTGEGEVRGINEDEPLAFSIPADVITSTIHQEQYREFESHDGFLNGLIACFKDFVKSLFNPAVIASHLAIFGLGVFVGRRLVS